VAQVILRRHCQGRLAGRRRHGWLFSFVV
jgi:hypothetical protein